MRALLSVLLLVVVVGVGNSRYVRSGSYKDNDVRVPWPYRRSSKDSRPSYDHPQVYTRSKAYPDGDSDSTERLGDDSEFSSSEEEEMPLDELEDVEKKYPKDLYDYLLRKKLGYLQPFPKQPFPPPFGYPALPEVSPSLWDVDFNDIFGSHRAESFPLSDVWHKLKSYIPQRPDADDLPDNYKNETHKVLDVDGKQVVFSTTTDKKTDGPTTSFVHTQVIRLLPDTEMPDEEDNNPKETPKEEELTPPEAPKVEEDTAKETPKELETTDTEAPKVEEDIPKETPKELETTDTEAPKVEEDTPKETPKELETTDTEAPKVEEDTPKETPKEEETTHTEAPKVEEDTPKETPKELETTHTEAPKVEEDTPTETPADEEDTPKETPKEEEITHTEAPKVEEDTETPVEEEEDSTPKETPREEELTHTEAPKVEEDTPKETPGEEEVTMAPVTTEEGMPAGGEVTQEELTEEPPAEDVTETELPTVNHAVPAELVEAPGNDDTNAVSLE